MLLLQSALKQLLSEDLLDKCLTVLLLTVAYPGMFNSILLTVAYPGLSLGILFFAKQSRKDSRVSEPRLRGQNS